MEDADGEENIHIEHHEQRIPTVFHEVLPVTDQEKITESMHCQSTCSPVRNGLYCPHVLLLLGSALP